MKSNYIVFAKLFLISGFFFVIQANYIYGTPFSWDQVDFTLGVTDFDLLRMQPHFPGYPFFIFLGTVLHKVLGIYPTKALIVGNLLVYSSSIVPIYFISINYFKNNNPLLISLVTFSVPYVWITVRQPMSEGMALGIMWWFLWSISYVYNKERPQLQQYIPAAILYSILLGTRLSYLFIGVSILIILLRDYKVYRRINRIFTIIILFIFLQWLWIHPLAISEGSYYKFIQLGLSFTFGHFNDWGGTSVSENITFFTRVINFLTNILWTNISAENITLFILMLLITYLFLKGKKTLKLDRGLNIKVLPIYLTLFGYIIWAFFAQNIDKPRHTIPVALLIIFVLFNSINKSKYSNHLIGLIIALNIAISGSFAYKQFKEVPATIQVADYLKKQENIVIYTWEEGRVFDYYNRNISYRPIKTYSKFLLDTKKYNGKRILVTNHVLNGFIQQDKNAGNNFVLLKTFKYNKLFEPVYYKISIYEYKYKE